VICFDYGQVDWTFIARIMTENNRRLSRTYKGQSDTGTSAEKLPLLLSGDALKEQVEQNEREVHKFIHAQRNAEAPSCAADVQKLLFHIADLTNHNLLPDGGLRTWPIEPNQRSLTSGEVISGPAAKVPPEKLETAIAEFAETIWDCWREIAQDPVPLAAWAEWELNGGSLHPFYDGCGRISRAFAAALLVRGRCLLPLFEDSAAYFTIGTCGVSDWVAYYRKQIVVCTKWSGIGDFDLGRL
jgi:hypothetical protein